MRLFILGAALLSSGIAYAQSGAPSDSAATLRAIQELSGQIKALNARMERLEKEVRANAAKGSSAAAAVPATQAPRAPARDGQSVPGWFVKLEPWGKGGNQMAMGGFAGHVSDYNFEMHSRHIEGQTRFVYHGESRFHPKEDGIYGFAIILEPVAMREGTYFSYPYNCSAEFRVDGNRIFGGATDFGDAGTLDDDLLYRSKALSGQVRLIPEPKKANFVEFLVDCWTERNKTADAYDRYFAGWKKNRFKILVKTPGDTLPRPARPDELYYIGKPS